MASARQTTTATITGKIAGLACLGGLAAGVDDNAAGSAGFGTSESGTGEVVGATGFGGVTSTTIGDSTGAGAGVVSIATIVQHQSA